ncbi:TetR/AcrR family transcriptional regulator [Kitasatospora sp. NPDC089509]|uniref:TetR/AcrR family transcriptional regulator n=1 Tax=Kitasatospora sp. NPDC089509 TaxID=3364079 RepID=UPI00382D5BAD
MPRVSRAEAQQHRQQVIDHTARLIREKGADQVSVPEAMAAAGLTHGGFYRHFSSKDDLIVQALRAAFTERREAMDRLADEASSDGSSDRSSDGSGPEVGSGRAEFLTRYLSDLHRDHPGAGCAAATLAADAARAEPGAPIRTAFTAGLSDLVDGYRRLDARAAGTDDAVATAGTAGTAGTNEGDRGTALAELSTLVGAILLARASEDPELSREILAAARRHLDAPA